MNVRGKRNQNAFMQLLSIAWGPFQYVLKLFIFESFCKQWIKAKNQMCLIVLQRTLFSDWPEDICRIYVFIHLSGFLYLFSLCLLYFFHWSNGARASSLQLHHQAISRFLHQQKVKVIYVPGIAHTLITSLNILHLIKLHQFYSYQSL